MDSEKISDPLQDTNEDILIEVREYLNSLNGHNHDPEKRIAILYKILKDGNDLLERIKK